MSATPVPPNTASSVNGVPAFIRVLIPAAIALALRGFLAWQFLAAAPQRKLDIETAALRAKPRPCGERKPTPVSRALANVPRTMKKAKTIWARNATPAVAAASVIIAMATA